ncbi:MAG: polymer-forming cytoskeletal protein [Proteobacteria bacterium]|nr:polymer-forming cytoskeletal protein [Pseudomonadota bacterium]
MQIANLKSKLISVAQNNSSSEGSITRRLEMLSSNFKTTPTIIAKDLTVEGSLTSSGVVEIEGNIKGLINGNYVILREGCFVEGSIISESLNIRGRFDGSIKAKNISISSKANVHGEIEYDSLIVEDGACIDGQFKRLKTTS